MRSAGLLAGLWLLVTASACSPAYSAKRRFTNEFRCGEEVKVRTLGADAYEVQGCGQRASYLCRGTTCLREYAESPRETPVVVVERSSKARSSGTNKVGATRGEDGRRTLRAQIGTSRFAIHLQATPGADEGIVHVGLRVWNQSAAHQPCELRLMADGQMLDMGETGYRFHNGYEELRSTVSYDDLFVWGGSTRVIGRVCDDEFRIGEERLNTVREFVVRLREEMTWQESHEETSGGDAPAKPSGSPAEGSEGGAGADASRDGQPEERGEVL